MNVSQKFEAIVDIELRSAEYTGLVTGVPGTSFSMRNLTRSAAGPAYIVRKEGVEVWKTSGFIEHARMLFLYGPRIDARVLSSILKQEKREALHSFVGLCRALATLDMKGLAPTVLHLRGVLIVDPNDTGNEGFLFLPQDLVRRIRDHQGNDERMSFFEPYNHPDADGQQNLRFALASLLFRILTGHTAYRAADEEDLHAEIRAGLAEHPQLLDSSIPSAQADLIHEALCDPRTHSSSINDWAEAAEHLLHSDTSGEVDESRLQELRLKLRRRRRIKSLQEFFRTKWSRIALVSVGILAAILIPGSIIMGFFEPLDVAELEPEEVVAGYYNALETLDHEFMRDALVPGTSNHEIDWVIRYYVVNNVRQVQGAGAGYIPVDEWLALGRPNVPEEQVVYGVTNLNITERSRFEDLVTFDVSYVYWWPESQELDSLDASVFPETAVSARREIVTVENLQRGWRISDRIVTDERLTTEEYVNRYLP